jgi:hypothetical protein
MKFIKLSLLNLMVCFLILGCKKDKAKELDPLDILTSKTWKYSLVDKNPSSSGVDINIPFNVMADCFKDNTFQFTKDGMVILNTGKVKCVDGEKEVITSTYTFNKETKELTVGGTKSIVLELTKNQFKYKAPVPHNTGYTYVLIILE